MSEDEETQKSFARAAQHVIDSTKEAYNIELRYDTESMRKLDAIIDLIGKPKRLDTIATNMGAFLGEALRHVYGGRWVWEEWSQSWVIQLPKIEGRTPVLRPIGRVWKRFEEGSDKSISYFVEVIDDMLKGRHQHSRKS